LRFVRCGVFFEGRCGHARERPAGIVLLHQALPDCSRSRSRCAWACCSARSSWPRRSRQARSTPLHQPATVGRSWVVVTAMACAGQPTAARNLVGRAGTTAPGYRPRQTAPVCRQPGGTVPRSSPITTAR
jgi:hypothetical protein